MSQERLEQWVGAAALAVLILGAVVLNKETADASAAGEEIIVDALFGQVDGVAVGDDVRISGVPVGRVTRLSLNERGQAVLRLALDPAAELPRDTSASIQTDGLFGRKFIILAPGFEEEPFENGDVITVTQDSVIVSDLLDQIISQGYANREALRRAAENR